MDMIFGDMNLIPTEYASVWKIQNKAKQTGKYRKEVVQFIIELPYRCTDNTSNSIAFLRGFRSKL